LEKEYKNNKMCEMLLTISFNFQLISTNCLTLSTRRRRRRHGVLEEVCEHLEERRLVNWETGSWEPVSSRDLSPQTKSNHMCAQSEENRGISLGRAPEEQQINRPA